MQALSSRESASDRLLRPLHNMYRHAEALEQAPSHEMHQPELKLITADYPAEAMLVEPCKLLLNLSVAPLLWHSSMLRERLHQSSRI